ncbi:unnamed protein product [Moneuplotes crassus]|uniref:Uncharacterized protein n=1 Tax=Euplotes crassus TaxID=5936 RepID=A0AAD1Y8M8_EUPCR|nr:unnamed protein product [Moneuplotes crassus]
MKILSSLLLVFIVLFSAVKGVHAEDEIDGGIMLRITNQFLETVKTELINEIFTHFRPTDRSYANSTDLDLFKVFYEITDIDLDDFGMDYRKSSIRFQEEKPNILIDLVDFKTNLDFNFNVTARPKFYDDVGEGAVHFEFDKFRIGLTIFEIEGAFQFKIDEINAELKEDASGSYFNGTGDLSFALNQAAVLLQGQLLQNPNETLAQIVNLALPSINSALARNGCEEDFGPMVFNWCAMQQPIFTDNDLVLVFKGEASPNVDTRFGYPELRKIPYKFDRSLKDISLFISDYTLNTTLWSAYYNDLLKYDLRTLGTAEEGKPAPPIPASTLFILFPELHKHVEKDTPLSIFVHAVDDVTPTLKIINGETTADLVVQVSFATLDSQGNRDPFLEVKSNMNVVANFRIDSPFTFKTDISKMRFKADELSLDKFVITNVRDLNSIIGTMSGFVRNFVNRQFSGMKFKEFDLSFIKMNVERTVLKEVDRYIYGSMAPRFESASTIEPLESHQVISKFNIKPATHDDKINALSELIKYTPLYASLQEFTKNHHLYEAIGHAAGAGLGMNLEHDFHEDAPLPKERTEDYS